MFLDVVTDRVDGEPLEEENPLLFRSDKTGRGPLKGITRLLFKTNHTICYQDFAIYGIITRNVMCICRMYD